jgi:hypothetical protein
MKKVNLQYAKDHLDSLVDEAMAGEDVVIAEGASRQVRLMPVPAEREKSREDEKPRREVLEEIVRRFNALPDLDTRSPEEILGYDERGLF